MVFSNGGAVNVMWKRNDSTLDHTDPQLTIHPPEFTSREDMTFIKSILEVCVTDIYVEGTYSCVAENETTILDENSFQIQIEGN